MGKVVREAFSRGVDASRAEVEIVADKAFVADTANELITPIADDTSVHWRRWRGGVEAILCDPESFPVPRNFDGEERVLHVMLGASVDGRHTLPAEVKVVASEASVPDAKERLLTSIAENTSMFRSLSCSASRDECRFVIGQR